MRAWATGARATLLCALFMAGTTSHAESALGDAAAKLDDPALTGCLERTLPARGLRERVVMRVFDETGSTAESDATLWWERTAAQRSRFLVRVDAPPLRAGIAVLAIERERPEPDMYLYLPELRQTRRVTGRTFSGAMLGTDFSFEDYAQVQGLLRSGQVRRLPDARLHDRAVFVAELIPASARSAYSRVVSSIDSEYCVPLLTQFIGHDGTTLKELTADPASIARSGDRYVAHRIVMKDLVQQTRTELDVRELELDPPMGDALFAPSSLGSVR